MTGSRHGHFGSRDGKKGSIQQQFDMRARTSTARSGTDSMDAGVTILDAHNLLPRRRECSAAMFDFDLNFSVLAKFFPCKIFFPLPIFSPPPMHHT